MIGCIDWARAISRILEGWRRNRVVRRTAGFSDGDHRETQQEGRYPPSHEMLLAIPGHHITRLAIAHDRFMRPANWCAATRLARARRDDVAAAALGRLPPSSWLENQTAGFRRRNARDKDGMTPLLSTSEAHVALILLRAGADPQVRNENALGSRAGGQGAYARLACLARRARNSVTYRRPEASEFE